MDTTLGVLFMVILASSVNTIAAEETAEEAGTTPIINDIFKTETTPAYNETLLSPTESKNFENQLYILIVTRKQDEAVKKSIQLYGNGYAHVIRDVMIRLITDGQPQVFDFAYKIVEAKATYIARTCFPYKIRMHEYLVFVKIINYKYNFALKYGHAIDGDGDRTAYGDPNLKTRFAITWKFHPIWHGDRVYFIIRPINLACFLKLGNGRDGDGDHAAFGADNYSTNRHLWYVKPVLHNNEILFFIINREYDELLKLGYATDSDGDRQAYGHSKYYLDPDNFAWRLVFV